MATINNNKTFNNRSRRWDPQLRFGTSSMAPSDDSRERSQGQRTSMFPRYRTLAKRLARVNRMEKNPSPTSKPQFVLVEWTKQKKYNRPSPPEPKAGRPTR